MVDTGKMVNLHAPIKIMKRETEELKLDLGVESDLSLGCVWGHEVEQEIEIEIESI